MDKAQSSILKPGKGWTLFLDRDGVINFEKEKDYIHFWEEFVFYPDAPQAIAGLSLIFSRVVVVTNQKGVGKGVTQETELLRIHRNMQQAIEDAGGRLDAIYYCTDISDGSANRKPNPGMAFQAQADFPDIRFSHSVMVGNNLSDLQFGRNAGMHTVFLRTTSPDLLLPSGLADMEAASLAELALIWGSSG